MDSLPFTKISAKLPSIMIYSYHVCSVTNLPTFYLHFFIENQSAITSIPNCLIYIYIFVYTYISKCLTCYSSIIAARSTSSLSKPALLFYHTRTRRRLESIARYCRNSQTYYNDISFWFEYISRLITLMELFCESYKIYEFRARFILSRRNLNFNTSVDFSLF